MYTISKGAGVPFLSLHKCFEVVHMASILTGGIFCGTKGNLCDLELNLKKQTLQQLTFTFDHRRGIQKPQ